MTEGGFTRLDACGGSNFRIVHFYSSPSQLERGCRRSEVACAVASLFEVRVDNLNHILGRFLARF